MIRPKQYKKGTPTLAQYLAIEVKLNRKSSKE